MHTKRTNPTATRPKAIKLVGVRVHNLRGVDVEIPLGRFVVVSGVSGSGKSSLAFDTLYAEGQRRYVESFPAYARQFLPKFDRPALDIAENIPPAIAVGQQGVAKSNAASVAAVAGILEYLKSLFLHTAELFCPKCQKVVTRATPERVTAELAALPAGTSVIIAFPQPLGEDETADQLAARLRAEGFTRAWQDTKAIRLGEDHLDKNKGLYVGVDRLTIGKSTASRTIEALETAFARGKGQCGLLIDDSWEVRYQSATCATCGTNYPPLTLSMLGVYPVRDVYPELPYRWGAQAWPDLLGMEVSDLRGMLTASSAISAIIPAAYRGVQSRLEFLTKVGLGYLTLQRPIGTLSTGEARRVALTTALGTGLARTLFVLDEPTAGLHPEDTRRLIEVMKELCADGNTVVVVEHDTEVIGAADLVIDLGPGAGSGGGRVLFSGTPAQLAECAESVTAKYLTPLEATPRAPRPARGSLRLEGACRHNLADLDVSFPLGTLCVVAGVSGAGKSSLVVDTLLPAIHAAHAGSKGEPVNYARLLGADRLDEVVLIDDQIVARSSRSNPATYLQVFDEIRGLFAGTLEAKTRGLGKAAFSFNTPGGRCERCSGTGYLVVDMQFLPEIHMICPDCGGQRYGKNVLEVKYRGLNMAEVLELTARDAFGYFRGQKKIQERLKVMIDVGLDYLRLGQALSTLSGGEAQRLKLASYLGPRKSRRCLFLFEEPTIGLHPADVETLVACFDALLDVGHSIIAIDHDVELLVWADQIVEMGPGAGAAGGKIIAEGPPDEIAKQPTPTGRLLAPIFSPA